jgi:superfamily II DNA/RNA helicase
VTASLCFELVVCAVVAFHASRAQTPPPPARHEQTASMEEDASAQVMAFRAILERKDVLVASHTGSGKTLAYLLPIVQELKRQEVAEGYTGRPRRPRALILSPTRELADQIAGVVKQLSHFAKMRSTVLCTTIK